MIDHPIRYFSGEAEVRRIAEGLLDRSLPRADWTHEAHLAATAWLVRMRPDIDLDRDIAGTIRGYNEAVGGVNDDHNGYHDTITRTYLASTRAFMAGRPAEPILEAINALLASPMGRRDWPLRSYSRERLFSVEARRGYLAPDLSRQSE